MSISVMSCLLVRRAHKNMKRFRQNVNAFNRIFYCNLLRNLYNIKLFIILSI